MVLNKWILLVVLVAAESALAQTGERLPIRISPPQYERQSPGAFTITVVDYQMADENRDWFPMPMPELVRVFEATTATKIEVDLEWNDLPLDDSRIIQSSMLYMTGDDAILQISHSARRNLGKYLKMGGFLFAEDIRHSHPQTGLDNEDAGIDGTAFDRRFKALMRDPAILGRDGAGWQKIPRDHPLYSNYWSFPNGPPMGGAPGANVFDLEMLQVRGRVAVIFSDLNISWYWGDPLADKRRRGLQFGVNLIVFAMSQQGIGPGSRR